MTEESPAEAPARQLIVIGSSAGGIDALSVLVRSLPLSLPVPIVLAQHLDPRRPSHLAEILARHTRLPIRMVDDRADLVAGTILVLPPDRQAEILDHEIVLRQPQEGGARPSIDVVLTSAARAFGEGLIAVILTGTGSDGAAGTREVKAAGGTVIIQNPETAAYPGMPEAIPPTTVDVVADLEAIGGLLNDLVTGAYVPNRPDDDRVMRMFLEQLRDRSGIDFSAYKKATIVRRLHRRMAATGTTALRDYTRYVHDHPEEYQRLTSSFLIKVTEFFRDADLFDYIRDVVLPRLIAEARQRTNELRFWSAGCATGEEAYSLAMLVADALGDDLDQFTVRIYATDVDGEAIAFARRGIYPPATLSSLPKEVVERHFTRLNEGYEVARGIRALTIFGQHDLGQRAPFPRIDLALCRNVLVYFTTDLQKRALQLFAFSLRDNGYLILGKAETTTPLSEYFVLENPRIKVYRRHGERVLIPPARIRDAAPAARLHQRPDRRPTWSDQVTQLGQGQRAPTTGERAESLLLHLPVGVATVDRSYDIQGINAAARALLAIHAPAVGTDFVHLLPDSMATPVRAALDASFRGESVSAIHTLPTLAVDTDKLRDVQISTHPLPADAGPGAVDAVLVVVTDVTASVRALGQAEAALLAERRERQRLEDHARLTSAANTELADANQQLTTANAELRSVNEELLVANEEVQAATEEVETLNEELQATNEELETLNEELQATVEELNTTNDDLQARSIEYQDSAAQLNDARRRAEAGEGRLRRILDALPYAILALDRTAAPIVANAAHEQLLAEGDGSFTDADGNPIVAGGLRRRAAAGAVLREELRDTQGRRYVAESRPVEEGGDAAAVLVIRRTSEDD